MNTGKWCSFHFYVGAHEKGGFPVVATCIICRALQTIEDVNHKKERK